MTNDVPPFEPNPVATPVEPQETPTLQNPLQQQLAWRPFIAGVAAGAALLGAVWGLIAIASSTGSQVAPDTFTLRGTMTLASGVVGDNPCRGGGGYADITSGTSVTVYSASGAVVGQGQLGLGQGSTQTGSCEFPIVVKNVPSGEKFYQTEVSHRGKITVSAENAKAGLVSMSLGF